MWKRWGRSQTSDCISELEPIMTLNQRQDGIADFFNRLCSILADGWFHWGGGLRPGTRLEVYSQPYAGPSPSMRRPVSVKSVFLFSICAFFAFESGRLCLHPSIRTLWLSDFRSVQVGRPHFSRCCYLRIDLDSHLFDASRARTWAQSPELGG